ncbi:penicillin-binding protein 2 [Natronincola peptidivorans]|uniref:Penicillin-binding protein 2 n=1 Tax=Natronincola peptidivorans TaxID=426128 RepID=A0A1H9YRM5_9FIRM|nr:penicillin-binding protein 2 [Natronincola peptidivorans]SES71708.1 penicillin-binding protein 2 [Natronincola peptidivorans]
MRKSKEKNQQPVYIKRLLFIGLISTLLIVFLVGRLFYIQILQHDFFVMEVNRQRQISIPTDSGRGILFDRNHIPLTDRQEKKIAVVFPQLFFINDENIRFLSEITQKKEEELVNRIHHSSSPIEMPITQDIDYKDSRALAIRGLFIIGKKQRYEDYPLLSHTLGYINQIDKKGMAGLEKTLDAIIMGNPTQSLTATLDGRKRFLPGEGYSVINTETKQKDIRLTIDYSIQKVAEEVMDQHNRNGAVVISNVTTGEILGLVSRPNYNPNTIADHIKSSGDELYNKAIQMTFPPGSIFKIVVAAAAIENNIINDDNVFHCAGVEKIGNVEINCNAHSQEENEEISFQEAFAKSCNSTFIQLGQKIGAKNIIEMAEELGLGSRVDIGLSEEEKGNLPQGNNLLGPAIGNISIGQGDIEVTPLQINQMTQIIANKGVKIPLNLLIEILVDSDTLDTFDRKEASRVLSQKTSIELQKLMESVMTEGTGKNIKELATVTAGKTGSAQGSSRGNAVLHAWFTGYYPIENPKYSITILVQEGGTGGEVAVPIFKEIIEGIMDIDY